MCVMRSCRGRISDGRVRCSGARDTVEPALRRGELRSRRHTHHQQRTQKCAHELEVVAPGRSQARKAHGYERTSCEPEGKGMRLRISCGKRSCTRRAPCSAAPTTTTGAGVATATMIHIRLEKTKPTSAPNSS